MEHDMGSGDDASATPQSMEASTAMEQDPCASSRPPFILLGIDGGATSTSCVAVDMSLLPSPVASPASSSSPPFVALSKDAAMRAVIGRGTAGSSNHNSIGVAAARSALQSAIQSALLSAYQSQQQQQHAPSSSSSSSQPSPVHGHAQQPSPSSSSSSSPPSLPLSSVTAVCFGLAGVDTPSDARTVHTWMQPLFPHLSPSHLLVVNDSLAAFAAATLGVLPPLPSIHPPGQDNTSGRGGSSSSSSRLTPTASSLAGTHGNHHHATQNNNRDSSEQAAVTVAPTANGDTTVAGEHTMEQQLRHLQPSTNPLTATASAAGTASGTEAVSGIEGDEEEVEDVAESNPAPAGATTTTTAPPHVNTTTATTTAIAIDAGDTTISSAMDEGSSLPLAATHPPSFHPSSVPCDSSHSPAPSTWAVVTSPGNHPRSRSRSSAAASSRMPPPSVPSAPLGSQGGIVVISGTGTVALGVRRYTPQAVLPTGSSPSSSSPASQLTAAATVMARASGAGPLLGDKGSGYSIASEALSAVMRAHDGRGRPTMLTSAILSHLGLSSVDDLISWVYRDLSWARIASLLPIVKACAAAGDAAAMTAFFDAADELAMSANAVACRLRFTDPPHSRFPLVLAGGALLDDSAPRLSQMLSDRLKQLLPHAHLIKPEVQAEVGAALLAWRQVMLPP